MSEFRDCVPWRSVSGGGSHRDFRHEPGRSSTAESPKTGTGIIAQRSDCFRRHVAGSLHRPLSFCSIYRRIDQKQDHHQHGRQGCLAENVFVERLWRSVKYEEVYLQAYDSVSEARASIGRYLSFYNDRRPHSSLDGMTTDQAYFAPLPLRLAA